MIEHDRSIDSVHVEAEMFCCNGLCFWDSLLSEVLPAPHWPFGTFWPKGRGGKLREEINVFFVHSLQD